MPLYHAFEWTHAAMAPLRTAAEVSATACRDPRNPWASTFQARSAAAAFDVFTNATRRYGKPEFGIDAVEVRGQTCAIREKTVYQKPFCNLVHFERYGAEIVEGRDPKVLIVAPMSGHFATLLRGTVESMLPEHDVYITDWVDARNVPLSKGRFDLEDYVEYLIEFLQFLGPGTVLMGVCQPGVPALAATALMCEDNDPCRPGAFVIFGSPIDTRISPTEPTELAKNRSLAWFEKNLVSHVPMPNPGFMRRVYPGFLQLSGFMTMNLDRHVDAAMKNFNNLIIGDEDSVEAHRTFYDEYLAVMDLTAEFYLQTVDVVFQRHLMPLGEMMVKGRNVDLSAIEDVPLMTIEGGKDDITGAGQTHAAHGLCTSIPKSKRIEYTNPDVGHYGQFNGGRWRRIIQPKVAEFIASQRREDG